MTDMETKTIRIHMKDWLFNAGITGIYRILEHAGHNVTRRANYIEFNADALEGFEKSFFYYFFDTYEKDSPWKRLMHFCSRDCGDFEDPSIIDDKIIKKFIDDFDKELTKASLCTAYEIIIKDKNHVKTILKTIKDKDAPRETKIEKIREIRDFFRENRDIIQAKYVSYSVIHNYWSGVSFLNKQQVKRDMFELYRKDFVTPALDYMATAPKKSPFGHCLTCNNVLNKKTDGSEGLTWLKMDVDTSRKTSVYWNHQPDFIFCPICYLVYTCVPAGFVTYKQKGLFINDNGNISKLTGVNRVVEDHLNDAVKMENLENVSYSYIINMIRQVGEKKLEKEISDIQVIKYDHEKGYSFNLLSKQVLTVIHNSAKDLDRLTKYTYVPLDTKNHINLYTQVIDCIYKNISLYPLIHMMTVLALKNNNRNIAAEIVFSINMNVIGGYMSESNEKNKIKRLKYLGLELKQAYVKRDAKNKIPGIAYRLLNYLKTRNINGFMDVVINSHMHLQMEVPTLFVDCIGDSERFQAYGYAFLLGFTGSEYKGSDKKSNEAAEDGNTGQTD